MEGTPERDTVFSSIYMLGKSKVGRWTNQVGIGWLTQEVKEFESGVLKKEG